MTNSCGRAVERGDAGFAPEAVEELGEGDTGRRVLTRNEVRPGGHAEAVARRGAKHESSQPVGEVHAEDQQVAVSELREQPFRRSHVAAHQAMDELEGILVVDCEFRPAVGPTEEVEHDGRLPGLNLEGFVLRGRGLIDGEFDLLRDGVPAEADLIEGARHQRVEGEADEHVEGADLGETPEGVGDRERWRHRSDESGDAIVENAELGFRMRKIGADGVVQLEVACPLDRELFPVREALGNEPLQGYLSALVVGLKELVANDGHDLAVLDVVQQVFPREVVVHRTLQRKGVRAGARDRAPVDDNDACPRNARSQGCARAAGHGRPDCSL